MRSISQRDIETLMQRAHSSPRKRAILRLHEHHEPVQRMVNALLPGTYVQPHKHENPDKVELFNILVGKIAAIHFDARGNVQEVFLLEATGETRIVDIPPRTFHTLLALEPSAALEIIQGPYDATTHKTFATWSPAEDSPKAGDYLMYLQSIVDNWR